MNTAAHAPTLVQRNAQLEARRRYLGGSGSVKGGASGKREPIRDPTARPANAQARKRESYKLPETRRHSSSDDNSPQRPNFNGSIGSSTFRLISPGVPRRIRTEGDGDNLRGGTVTTVGKPLRRLVLLARVKLKIVVVVDLCPLKREHLINRLSEINVGPVPFPLHVLFVKLLAANVVSSLQFQGALPTRQTVRGAHGTRKPVSV